MAWWNNPGGDQSNQPPPGLATTYGAVDPTKPIGYPPGVEPDGPPNPYGYPDGQEPQGPPSPDGSNPDGSTNGFDFGGFIKDWFTNGSGNMSSMIPALATALQQYNNAGKYTDLGREAANRADPFGDRSFYRDRLRASYDDPSTILNDPGHKIQVQRGLDSVAANGAMKGYLGSTNMGIDLSKYASDSDATYLDAERGRLGNLAGAQFDPANAARYLMEGGKLSMDSQNAALGALFTQFNNKNSPQNKDKNGNPINPNRMTTQDIAKTIDGLTDPISIARALGQFGGNASAVMARILTSGNNISSSTKSILEDMAKDPQYAGLFTTGGGTDHAPISIFNPDGTINSQFPGYNEGAGGGPGADLWDITGGSNDVTNPPSLDWDNPDTINWDNVNFDNFTDTDWDNMFTMFSDYSE